MNMRFNDLVKSLFILFLFVVAAWSATLWPILDKENSMEPVIDGIIEIGEYPVNYVFGDAKLYIYNNEYFYEYQCFIQQ